VARKPGDNPEADAEGGGGELEVSQPGDAAEKEADAVADRAAESLHGADATEKKGESQDRRGDETGETKAGDEKQEKPPIAAKLDGVGRTIYRNRDENNQPPVNQGNQTEQNKKQQDEELKRRREEAARKLAAIPVAKLPAGSPKPHLPKQPPQFHPTQAQTPGVGGQQQQEQQQPELLERDTYYVSTAAGAQMIALLTVFSPEVSVRQAPKGFLVRKQGGAEWYFEYREQALSEQGQTGGGNGAQTGSETQQQEEGPQQEGSQNQQQSQHAGTELGLPTPNAASIELWGFRGVRTVNEKYVDPPKDKPYTPDQLLSDAERARVKELTAQYPLLWAGHIGVSVDGGATIYGFTPQMPPEMSKAEFMNLLKANHQFPGAVKDDTAIFRLADQMAQMGWNTEVMSVAQVVDSPQKQEIVERINTMRGQNTVTNGQSGHGLYYQFPYPQTQQGGAGGAFETPQTANCAIFPAIAGIPVPESTGQLNAYIPELEKWAQEGIIDIRGATPDSGGG
jgi:hypothetical protein